MFLRMKSNQKLIEENNDLFFGSELYKAILKKII